MSAPMYEDIEFSLQISLTWHTVFIDFKLSETVKLYYLGKSLEDHVSLTSQNVQPNSLLHLVRTKLHLLPRAQKLPGENKSLRPPGAFKKKSDLSVKDGHVCLME
jgi:transcription initiation factor TFIID subunit 1